MRFWDRLRDLLNGKPLPDPRPPAPWLGEGPYRARVWEVDKRGRYRAIESLDELADHLKHTGTADLEAEGEEAPIDETE